ncbi:hypothetical protein G7067_03100 [Leucobacter insecticola]|uniref:DUF1648 domain-containing protein n=1 Tax=Leucobacter insecticola TaxID=2714934 RepID=A0A6G8FGX9_9MICO|nr:hypothetical protein [Leucobacter insecticola]QIM15631.1 hypothetical protein G7067_03100 [Leucobacter insecticola]
MSTQRVEERPAVPMPQRVRIVAVGMIGPPVITLSVWWITSSWSDLPAQIPSHWSGGKADSFLSPEAVINAWSLGCLIAALAAISVTSGAALGWRWSGLGRMASAAGVGATGAVAAGLYVQLLVSRGMATEYVVELGAAPGIISVMGGFVCFSVVALLALPKGQQ